MASRIGIKLSDRKIMLLAGGAMAAIAGSMMIDLVDTSLVRAQSKPNKALTFEVASVRAHAPGQTRLLPPQFLPGGSFTSDAPLFIVIAIAYNLPFNPSVRLSGAPDWTRSPEGAYHIEATAGTGALPEGLSVRARNDAMRLMLQTLLADRFKLAIHHQTREMSVSALVVAKGGPKLQEADIDEKNCLDETTACHTFTGGQGRGLHARAVDMTDLARYVENWTDRPLVDRSGVKGLFHIETKGWQTMQPGPPPAPGARSEDGTNVADVPTLFNVFAQLGLKMESRKAPVDLYVIDHVERPTEN